MLTHIHPKLPMRSLQATKSFYTQIGFAQFGGDYPDYLMLEKDSIQLHFFLFEALDPLQNYGQVYIRTNNIDEVYATLQAAGIHTFPLEDKLWRQREFALLDPDHNLLTFGQSMA